MSLRILVTGGGTGGHVFPALEVAKLARLAGHDVQYFGSLRGQEAAACASIGLPFTGFASEPVYRPFSVKGVRSLVRMLKAAAAAQKAMKRMSPQVVLGTGGYSSAPVMMAAKKCNDATVLHEQNSVPGRTQLMAARSAFRVCTVFHGSAQHFSGSEVVRTGMPVREEFRQLVPEVRDQVLVMGGSQGSASLNRAAVGAAKTLRPGHLRWVHVTGKTNLEETRTAVESLGTEIDYDLYGYLEGPQMAQKMGESRVALSRSGAGTIAELAAVGVPSVLVPYKYAYGDHQRVNAEEMSSLGAATVLAQDKLTSEAISRALSRWIDAPDERETVRRALADWDVPDAAERILAIMIEAAN